MKPYIDIPTGQDTGIFRVFDGPFTSEDHPYSNRQERMAIRLSLNSHYGRPQNHSYIDKLLDLLRRAGLQGELFTEVDDGIELYPWRGKRMHVTPDLVVSEVSEAGSRSVATRDSLALNKVLRQVSGLDAQRVAVVAAEKALGENLHWLSDKLDMYVRQGDEETLKRLKALHDAWELLARAKG